MAMSSFRVLALAAALLAASCSFTKDELAPSFEASDPGGTAAAAAQPAAPAATQPAAPQPAAPASSSSYWPSLTAPSPAGAASANPPAAAAPATPTPSAAAPQTTASTVPAPRGGSAASTIAGNAVAPGRVDALRADLRQLQADVAQHMSDLQRVKRQLDETAAAQESLASGIEQRLKSTTVPNDPQLSSDLAQAQAQLVKVSDGISRLNNIASYGTSDAALASYVQQKIRATMNDPEVSEADRRQLGRLEVDAAHASASVDQLVTQASGEIASRSLFLASAQRRLAALGPEVAAGQERATRAAAAATPSAPAGGAAAPRRGAPAASAAGAPDVSGRRALVTIHFDRPNVAYENDLYNAVKQTLDRRPNAAFDIVAVSPPGQAATSMAAAQRNVESVVHSLSNMGLPADRFRLSAATLADASGNEVRIYVR